MYKNEVYSARLDTPGRTFFFDVKRPGSQPGHLTVTQTRVFDGERERERIVVYAEDVEPFMAALNAAVKAMVSTN